MRNQGDFTVSWRLIWIAALASFNGAICSLVALALLSLIAFFTNLFFFQTISLADNLPANNQLGWLAIFVPVIGGLLIGLMARFGSERIRGHGIPEAMEAILFGCSRMRPKVALLKPLSSAISLGSGGPFGAEGPIIMTGGAFGSIVAQAFRLTSAERKTLLVAGAAGGMTAVFGTPVAAVLLAVELLLFEWKPRSLIPVALAAATAALVRPMLLGTAPMIAVEMHASLTLPILLSAALLGIAVGALSIVLTLAVYKAEDVFDRLPIHWMWWPAVGGLIIGVGGYFQPRALGMGKDIIEDLLHGNYVPQLLLTLFLVKGTIWAMSLGSGTSGGVFAPWLILGGCLGGNLSTILPGDDKALWPLLGMAAVLGGTLRSPLTGILFALELTYDIRALPALLIATIFSCAVSVLLMRRSIMTEKISRRGRHISSEYEVDPLERLSIGEVMTSDVIAIPAPLTVQELMPQYFLTSGPKRHQGYPVVDRNGRLLGVLTRSSLLDDWNKALLDETRGQFADQALIIAYDLLDRQPITAFPWESCRAAALRMAEYGVGRLPVVDPDNPRCTVGMVTRSDLLKARHRLAEEEGKRESYFSLRPSPNSRFDNLENDVA